MAGSGEALLDAAGIGRYLAVWAFRECAVPPCFPFGCRARGHSPRIENPVVHPSSPLTLALRPAFPVAVGLWSVQHLCPQASAAAPSAFLPIGGLCAGSPECQMPRWRWLADGVIRVTLSCRLRFSGGAQRAGLGWSILGRRFQARQESGEPLLTSDARLLPRSHFDSRPRRSLVKSLAGRMFVLPGLPESVRTINVACQATAHDGTGSG